MAAFDLYVWASPRDLDADGAEAMVSAWEAAGADPSQSPFEPSTDVGWLHRELIGDAPALDVVSDAVPRERPRPILLETEPEAPARLVAVRVRPDTSADDLESLLGLAMKYDLVVYDARRGRVHRPLEEQAAYASATFWPRGAVQAAVAGLIGVVLAVGAWVVAIPVLSGIVVVVGGFMAVMAVYTFVHEGRATVTRSRSDPSSEAGPPPD
jgi:hypothetical protein